MSGIEKEVERTSEIPEKMQGVILIAHGGPENLVFRDDLQVPKPDSGQILIKVHAAAINNTDINTRTGWYSKAVTGASGDTGQKGADDDGSWSGEPLEFPRIQGADCAGEIVAVGEGVNPNRMGQRVIVATLQVALGNGEAFSTGTYGSECDGAFAEYCTAIESETHAVETNLTDIELGAIPCTFSTAEGMLQRAGLVSGERVFIAGASGGVGSAAVQLARLRGANIAAQTGSDKAQAVRDAGASEVVDRDVDLLSHFGAESFDVIVDLVAGPGFGVFTSLLKRGGRYVTAGAIAGPIVELDVRDLYLKDLTLFGCTFQPPSVFEAIVKRVNKNEIKPLVSKTYPLRDIHRAQKDFMAKTYPGKLVLVP